MSEFDYQEHPHRRLNPLSGEWVLVSPHRAQRPWQGREEEPSLEELPSYDPDCYLCPGNIRAGGIQNPDYDRWFVFDNDFPGLLPTSPEGEKEEEGLMVSKSEKGLCRVVCFSPRHDLTLARMDVPGIEEVVQVWSTQFAELGSIPWIRYVQIFENRGALMGCSNPHPHGQIWANQTLPNEPWKEQENQLSYSSRMGCCLLCRYLELELNCRKRVVWENEHFVALVPFWAIWPFETLVLSRKHLQSLTDLNRNQRHGLAVLLKRLTTCYDNLFRTAFPYSMGFHQRPTDGFEHREWHLHAHFYPPLLRSATVKKFMVGYEMLATPQRDITPEGAAQRLREVPVSHYRESQGPDL